MAKIFDFEKAHQEHIKKNTGKETGDKKLPEEQITNPDNIPFDAVRDIMNIMSLSEKMTKIATATKSATQSSIQKGRESVRPYTTKQLIKWVEDSNELLWLNKSGFYRAVIEKLREKMGNIIGK